MKNLYCHLIEGTILTGCAKGRDVFTPPIPPIPTHLPFDFKRIQFPVRLAFAMSINKVQGQSLKIAGIHLQNRCFSHGQLYVACSRVGHLKKPAHSGPWRENKKRCISRSTTMIFLAQHNYPVPLFLEQDMAFCDDAVPLIVHMSALSLSTGAFRRAHHIYFTVTHFHPFPFPYIRKYHRPSGFAIGNPGQCRVPRLVLQYTACITLANMILR